MNKTISLTLSGASIDNAIQQLQSYKPNIAKKTKEVCRRLAQMGATNVSLGYARAIYTGGKDISVTVEETSSGYKIIAQGKTVLFVEFGAGVTYGYGHPQAGEFGMGPGTYPDGKGHWDDPKGWWIPGSREHTYGNPPNPVMYNTAKELKEKILMVAMEVFASD